MIGRVALITGSTSGIGLGIARRLAENGCSVILTGLGGRVFGETLAEEFNGAYRGQSRFVEADLVRTDGVSGLCSEVSATFPDGPDILVNNAGIQHVCPIEEFPIDKWQNMFSVHLDTPFRLIRHFLPNMKSKGWGRIISVSSIMGHVGHPGKVPYCTMKAGQIGMIKALSLETAVHGVTCNVVCPGYVETELIKQQILSFSRKHSIKDYETARDKFLADKHPTRQPVTVEQVAGVVQFLCSDDAASITGTALTIDGGYLAK